jgi:cystinosin
MLDFTGGTFSILQDIIKAVGHGTSPFDGGGFNIVKWMLGIMSIVFDIIFMIQHFILYKDSNHEIQEKLPLKVMIFLFNFLG